MRILFAGTPEFAVPSLQALLDSQHEHFQIFNNHGDLLLFVGKYSADNDGFVNPVSMFIDKKNRMYVTDQLNARVQVFQILNSK